MTGENPLCGGAVAHAERAPATLKRIPENQRRQGCRIKREGVTGRVESFLAGKSDTVKQRCVKKQKFTVDKGSRRRDTDDFPRGADCIPSSISPMNIPPYCCPQLGAHTHTQIHTHTQNHACTQTHPATAVWLGEGNSEMQGKGEGW